MKIKSESDSILADYPTPASSTRAGSVITKQEPVDLTLSDDEGDIHSNHLVSSDGIPRDNSPAHPRTTSAPEPGTPFISINVFDHMLIGYARFCTQNSPSFT